MVWVYPYLDESYQLNLVQRHFQSIRFEYDLLSPANDSTMLNIENKLYPSISHYLNCSCCAQTMPGFENIDKAMELFLMGPNRFFSVADSESRLMNLEQTVFTKEKTFLLQKAIRNKFDQRKFKDILIATGDKVLVYAPLKLTDDARRLKYQGLAKPINIVTESNAYRKETTNFLEKIRPTILPEDVIFSNNNAFKTSFEYDEFMEMFMVEKVKDISFTIKCVQVFCKHKDLPFSPNRMFC